MGFTSAWELKLSMFFSFFKTSAVLFRLQNWNSIISAFLKLKAKPTRRYWTQTQILLTAEYSSPEKTKYMQTARITPVHFTRNSTFS